MKVDEDSSYDSDTEAGGAINSPHKNVSRNGSETLAQELDDFNSVGLLTSQFWLFPHSLSVRTILPSFNNMHNVVVYSELVAHQPEFVHVMSQ